MPIRQAIVHMIDKKPDGSPAILYTRDTALDESEALNEFNFDLNEAYNARQGKGWGLFHPESGGHPLSGWLKKYLAQELDFVEFSKIAVEHLTN